MARPEPSASAAGSKTRRLFIAAPLTEALRTAVGQVQRRLRPLLPQMRWVDPATLHLTLRFIGAADEESIEKIAALMLSVGGFSAPLAVRVAGLGAFPHPARARVAWLGVADAAELFTLERALAARLDLLPLPREERPYTPHLTIGRCRAGGLDMRTALSQPTGVDCGELPIDRIVLYESRLHPTGAIHLPLHTVLLGASRGARHDGSGPET